MGIAATTPGGGVVEVPGGTPQPVWAIWLITGTLVSRGANPGYSHEIGTVTAVQASLWHGVLPPRIGFQPYQGDVNSNATAFSMWTVMTDVTTNDTLMNSFIPLAFFEGPSKPTIAEAQAIFEGQPFRTSVSARRSFRERFSRLMSRLTGGRV